MSRKPETLRQQKKQQKNLEYGYKQLKQPSRSTGEAEIQKIKEGFPYFEIFDMVMGHRDSIDPSNEASQIESVNVSLDESEPPDDVTEVQKSS